MKKMMMIYLFFLFLFSQISASNSDSTSDVLTKWDLSSWILPLSLACLITGANMLVKQQYCQLQKDQVLKDNELPASYSFVNPSKSPVLLLKNNAENHVRSKSPSFVNKMVNSEFGSELAKLVTEKKFPVRYQSHLMQPVLSRVSSNNKIFKEPDLTRGNQQLEDWQNVIVDAETKQNSGKINSSWRIWPFS